MEKKKTIIKSIYFFLPAIIISIIFEITLRNIPNDFDYKEKNILRTAKNIRTLILGASQSLYGLNPEYIDSETYNMAYVSQSILLDNLVFKKYYSNLPRLKNVILPISYVSLSHTYNYGQERWRKFNYFRYYHIEPPIPEDWYFKYYWEIFNLPWNKNVEKLVLHLKDQSLISVDKSGWSFTYNDSTSINTTEAEISAELTYERHEDHSMDFCKNIELINEIIEICKSSDITVFLIMCPVSSYYENLLNKNKLSKIKRTCEMLELLNENVKFYDYFSDNRFALSDFHDVDHLNGAGAIKFSKIVKTEVLNN